MPGRARPLLPRSSQAGRWPTQDTGERAEADAGACSTPSPLENARPVGGNTSSSLDENHIEEALRISAEGICL